MPKIRVLVVDDAVVVRSRLSKLLAEDPELEVVGVAANGRIALAKIAQLNPNVVILDVEMPDMDGLATLAALRQTYPHIAVIMFSTFTRAGAIATLDALSLGASDYATKPSHIGDIEAIRQHVFDDLVPKIKLFGTKQLKSQTSKGAQMCAPTDSRLPYGRVSKPARTDSRLPTPKIVAVGVSTGGPNALAVLLSQLPADFPVPIAIVQHMPPMFTQLLAERLAAKSRLKVAEAVSGRVLEPGQVWIAPGNFHLAVQRDGKVVRLVTHQAPPENSCRPSVDVLFSSVAEVFGASAIAIVLTGMGQDGLRGCQQLREAGGRVFVQDEASSVVWGMPGFVANAGLANRVLPIDQMADETIRQVCNNT
ncbi:chemotaxis response regulator protein-glutamate methylesterase [Chroococcidiopsis sp. FACHB-1243]|uniref:protein-glutamate methylesterase/protein-glutamine glutaminase n=1 Tax=Chroococcidiopsis sp. [FACHB-1243] TaxID=2692781 RepID=UPI00177CF99C|nr:chemotaxis response regulator protein-glutamate methylesterase [Chroococcidiopsis sp. [FACHB-1243]]MBD2307064.1 chemotaxis response regulator protein-glutamate methylesterase [Chroococcidiopsis sp. [FACHB-1243]]